METLFLGTPYQKGYPMTLSSAVHFSTGRFQMIAITDFTGPIF
jgi:hypothetical protein